MKICRKYGQDSILYSEKGDRPRYYTKTGQIDSSFSRKFVFNDKEREFFTDMKKALIINALHLIWNRHQIIK